MRFENKQRIIGIVVLVAFVALLIPFLFTSGIRKKLSTADEMPINAQKRQLITQQIQNIDSIDKNTTVNTTTNQPSPVVVPEAVPAIAPAATTVQPAQPAQTATLPQDSLEQTDMLLPSESKQTEPDKNIGIASAPTEKASSQVATEQVAAEAVEVVEPVASIVPEKSTPKKSKAKATKKTKIVKKIKGKKTQLSAINSKDFWSVQVGSFSDQARIQKIVDQLHAKGFHVYMQKITTSTGSLTRVLVGHEASKEGADEIAAQIESSLKIKGHLVRNQK